MTAQQSYAAMIKDRISPALRHEGLTGSGGRYAIPSATHFALVGFQKSAFSDRDDVRFTINLLVVDRAEWAATAQTDPFWRDRPAANTKYGAPVHTDRIGSLVGDHQDKWWRVDAAADIESIAVDVLGDLTSAGLPWLRARM